MRVWVSVIAGGVVLHRGPKCEQNRIAGTRLRGAFLCVPLAARTRRKHEETRMPSRIETYRVSAYNTAKLSENKMHDDTVAKRFGFSGGLVPGVDVMAYMMHMPVARWGRAFLEHGLIDARFVKPVYDGENADVIAEENNGVLAIEVKSRGDLCATGSATLPASPPSFSLVDYREVPAVAERKPVSASSYEVGKWLGTTPRQWAGEAATSYLADIRETDPIFAREGLGHPGLIQKVM